MTDNFERRIIDFFIPPKCAICKELADHLVCDECRAEFIPIVAPFCKKCGMPLDIGAAHDFICADCRNKNWHFVSAISAGVFTGTLRDAILNLKYHDMVRTLAKDLALFMAENIALPENIDFLAPVPLHKKSENMRGYNQSLLIAKHLGKYFDVPVIADLLKKVHDTPMQHFLSREKRAQINRAFEANTKLDGENIAIIDDVFTTGMTANACARALSRAGAGDIYILSVARAVPRELILKFRENK